MLYNHTHTHTYIFPHSDGCGSSQSFLHPHWAVIQSRGPAQPRPPHRICAQDTGLTQWTHRGSIIPTTWLKMCKMTAFNDMKQAAGAVSVICKWISEGCLIFCEHENVCVQLLLYLYTLSYAVIGQIVFSSRKKARSDKSNHRRPQAETSGYSKRKV